MSFSASRLSRAVLGALAFAAMIAIALAGCSSHDDSSDATKPVTWSRVSLPGGATPVTLTAMGDGLLVGARDESARVAPRLLVLGGGGDWTPVPLHPHTFYAFRAQFRSVLTDGRRIYAFGDASGGAHFNARWTTWSGDIHGVTEYEQGFSTFGGWGAGTLTGMTFVDSRPVIVGSWSGADVGLDIVFWHPQGHDWVRGTSTGTVLASNEHALNVIRAIGAGPDGAVLAGAITLLGGGQVRLAPAIWKQSGPDGTWARVVLPTRQPAQATQAQCGRDSCLAAGPESGHLALWTVANGRARAVPGVPDVAMADDALALVGPAGATPPRVLTSSGQGSVLLTPGSPWTTQPGPPGSPLAWAFAHGHTYVITQARDGTSALWLDGRG